MRRVPKANRKSLCRVVLSVSYRILDATGIEEVPKRMWDCFFWDILQEVGGMRVVFVGVSGCSGSGKSSFARRLSARLDSPLLPLQLDWFFKPVNDHFEGGAAWEAPTAVDHEQFLDALTRVRDAVTMWKCSSLVNPASGVVPCDNLDCDVCHFVTCRRKRVKGSSLLRPGRHLGYHHTGSGEPLCFIVVEGFLLYAWPEITSEMVARVTIEASPDVCCKRRFLRENGWDQVVFTTPAGSADAAIDAAAGARHGEPYEHAVARVHKINPTTVDEHDEFSKTYRPWYQKVVHAAFSQYWPTQLHNAKNVGVSDTAAMVSSTCFIRALRNDDEDCTNVLHLAQEVAQELLDHFDCCATATNGLNLSS